MKHIKLYQNYKGPKIGDYVLVNTDFNGNEYQNFVNNNVGKIKNIKHSKSDERLATIEYKNIPASILYRFDGYDLSKNVTQIVFDDIIEWSKTRKDMQVMLTGKKFNL